MIAYRLFRIVITAMNNRYSSVIDTRVIRIIASISE
jgi:hypothetical protein